jgi:phage tail P2-like protein
MADDATTVLPVQYADHLLPINTTWLERVLAAAGELRVAAIPAPIDTVKQPAMVPVDFEPWLAWELSVDLWLDSWSQQQLRWVIANSLRQHTQKGTLDLIAEYVSLLGGTVKTAIRPPAKFYAMPAFSAAERAAYLARFPQLRIYPYVARVELPWSCYVGNPDAPNGHFMGQLYPTNADAGGRWTRTAMYYDPPPWGDGVETPLTFRTVVEVGSSEQVTTYDEVVLPARPGTKWFPDQPPTAHIYLGALDPVDARTVRIPRDGSLELIENKAIYTTIVPGLDMIDVYPEYEFIEHDAQPGSLFPRRGGLLAGVYLTASVAWRYVYEVWWLLDPTRVPDVRKRSMHMGHARFGIAPFTCEMKIEITGLLNPRYFARWMWGFMRPAGGSSDTIARARAAVQRGMSLRDQVLINTNVWRVVEVADAVPCDGSVAVGEMIEG